LGFNSESVDIWQLFDSATGSKSIDNHSLRKEGRFCWLDLNIAMTAGTGSIISVTANKTTTKTYSYTKPSWLPSGLSFDLMMHCSGGASAAGGGGLWEADLPIKITTSSSTYTLSFSLVSTGNVNISVTSIKGKPIFCWSNYY